METMTQKQKDLLLKDICSRLPYGVKCQIQEDEDTYIGTLRVIEVDNRNGHLLDFAESISGLNCQMYLSEIKPYLFPMSSMTKEQKKEFAKLLVYTSSIESIQITGESTYDWLNRNMFDWRGLIEKGLALKAPDGMYNQNI